MIRYKLTDKYAKTRRGMMWEIGKTNRATGKGKELCSDGFLHVYETAEQAVFMAPAHVDSYTRIFEVEVPEVVVDDGTKQGVKEATPIREIEMPVIGTDQRVEIGIRVSLLVYKEPSYVTWAENWLNGKDRSFNAANSAANAAYSAANSAANAANSAAYSAANAAYSAANSAAYSAANAANSAAYSAAYSAANSAAYSAANSAAKIDLVSIIKKVMG
jgi:hypothetical protein